MRHFQLEDGNSLIASLNQKAFYYHLRPWKFKYH